jgi:hypothetical protein
VEVADRVAVRAGLGVADHRQHARLELLGDAHLEGLGLLVDLVPRDAHDLDQERLDEAVAAHDVLGDALTLVGQGDLLVPAAHDQAVGLHPADHLGHAGRGDLHGPGQVARRALDAGLGQPVERLEVFLDRGAER